MAATSAYRDETGQEAWVSGGAVAQDGKLKLMVCNTCGGEVVWATSIRTGRKYRVDVSKGESGCRYYAKRNAHDCARRLAAVEQARRAAATSEVLEARRLVMRALVLAGHDVEFADDGSLIDVRPDGSRIPVSDDEIVAGMNRASV